MDTLTENALSSTNGGLDPHFIGMTGDQSSVAKWNQPTEELVVQDSPNLLEKDEHFQDAEPHLPKPVIKGLMPAKYSDYVT